MFDSFEENIIRKGMLDNQITEKSELARRTGINRQRLDHRLKSPGEIKLFELRAIVNELGLSHTDVLSIALGKEIRL